MKKFVALFKKVGGGDLFKQYLKCHVLFYAVFQILIQGFSKKSLEIARLSINNKILKRLRRKNRRFIQQYVKEHANDVYNRTQSNKVWVCWLQGIDAAPELVQLCYKSFQNHLIDQEVIVITEENYRDYVSFPDYIQKKIDSGIITRTHMSDLLRLELLIQYGGTWIDATVYCSGSDIPKYMFQSELFVFQTLKPGLDGQCTAISSWFMSASTNHPILLLTRELLYRYWRNKNSLIDYFLIHDCFQLAIEAYPEEWEKVVPFSNSTPHIMLLRLFEKYDEELYEAICKQTPFHKLSYKFDPEMFNRQETFYKIIVGQGSRLSNE